VFRPKYPLASGIRYPRGLHAGGGAPTEKILDSPSRSRLTPDSACGALYHRPTSFRATSSASISSSPRAERGEAEQRIHVLDADNKGRAEGISPGQELGDQKTGD